MKSVVMVCPECDGFGVSRVAGGPKHIALVCGECEGSGKKTFYFKPFTARRERKGIKWVVGRSIATALGFGPFAGPRISYGEFLAGKLPQPDAPQVLK